MPDPKPKTKQREEIRLPGPSASPLATAIGLSLLLVGLVVNWVIIAVGGVVLFVSMLWWIAEAKRDFSQLPE